MGPFIAEDGLPTQARKVNRWRVSLTLEHILRRVAAHRPKDLDAAKRASVALIVRDAAKLEVLLIRRTERENDPWSGHMAFPGGRQDPTDPDALGTALRETREEIGLDLDTYGRLVGRLDDCVAFARGERLDMAIRPFVFSLHTDAAVHLSEEVAEVVWADLELLHSGAVDARVERMIYGTPVELPAYKIQDKIVWGLTHRMISSFFEILAP